MKMDFKMNWKSLKSALKFWQEIVFIIGLGVLVFGMAMNAAVAFHQVFNIVSFCIFVSLLICLIGQFYWKSLILALCLAVIFGLGSLYMTLGWFVEFIPMTKAEESYAFAVFSLFLFMGLTVTAITMPFKYKKGEIDQ